MPGFENIVGKTASQRYVVVKKQRLGDLVPRSGHPLKIESDSTSVGFVAQSAVQQCNPRRNELATLAPQQGFAPS